MNESAKKGKCTGGSTPLGYYVDADKHYHVNETEAALVREAFRMYADDLPVKDICARMAELGLRTRPSRKVPQGSAIKPSTIAYMVTNRRYIGVNEFNGGEYSFPALIDEETFELCRQRNQRMKIRTGSRNSAAKTSYMLVSKAVCGRCGMPIIGDSGKGQLGNSYHYYTCSTRKKKASECRLQRFKKDWLENLVLDVTRTEVLTVPNIITIADHAVSQNQADTSILHSLVKRQQDNEMAIQNLLRAMEMGIFSPTTKARLDELENEKNALMGQIAS